MAGVTVLLEQEVVFERGNVVVIYLDRRDSEATQVIAAGTRHRYDLQFSIWCFHFALDITLSLDQRDDLVGNVEIALMKDRTLQGTVDDSDLAGGEFLNGRTPEEGGGLFFAGAEVRLVAQAVAIT